MKNYLSKIQFKNINLSDNKVLTAILIVLGVSAFAGILAYTLQGGKASFKIVDNKKDVNHTQYTISYPSTVTSYTQNNPTSYPINTLNYTYYIDKDLSTEYLLFVNPIDTTNTDRSHKDDPKANSIYNYYAYLNRQNYKEALEIAPQGRTEIDLKSIYETSKDIEVSSVIKLDDYTYEAYVSLIADNQYNVYKIKIHFNKNSQSLIEKIETKPYSGKYYIICKIDKELTNYWCSIKSNDNFIINDHKIELIKNGSNIVHFVKHYGGGRTNSMFSIFSLDKSTGEFKYVDFFDFDFNPLGDNEKDTVELIKCRDTVGVNNLNEYINANGCYYPYKKYSWYDNNIYYLQNKSKYFNE